jgi:hypothetical protein
MTTENDDEIGEAIFTEAEVALELAKGLCAGGLPVDVACITAWTVGLPAFLNGERQYRNLIEAVGGLGLPPGTIIPPSNE